MADPEEPPVREIIIIRRRGGDGEEGHHGGAWKIAFADFMTAMMAFFLVLWIVNSTSKETRSSVARYFNPIKITDTTPARRGLQDPRAEDFNASDNSAQGRSKREDAPETKNNNAAEPGKTSSSTSKPAGGASSDASGRSADQPATTLELRLFEEPQVVLREIVAAGLAEESVRLGDNAALAPTDAPFRDPFAFVQPVLTRKPTEPSPLPRGAAPDAPSVAAEPRAAGRRSDQETEAAKAQKAEEAQQAKAKALESEIAAAFAGEANRRDTPSITVSADKDGLLISLTDNLNFSMFDLGSAIPNHRTVLAVDKITSVLKSRTGKVIVRGYTDARPFRKGGSDNWRLSLSRAQAVFYMLVRGGLTEQRLERIEGHGDRSPRNAADPLAPENRRVEILLRGDAP
jgi:chemotaxis protein MotB